jgi:hypothetical protein
MNPASSIKPERILGQTAQPRQCHTVGISTGKQASLSIKTFEIDVYLKTLASIRRHRFGGTEQHVLLVLTEQVRFARTDSDAPLPNLEKDYVRYAP